VLAADACYTRENMDRDVLPNTLWDPAEMSRSPGHAAGAPGQAGAMMIYGHDVAQWQEMRRAPTPPRVSGV
jgi:hypothetical protein